MDRKPERLALERVLLEGIEEMVFIVRIWGGLWVYEFINDAVKTNTTIRDSALGKSIRDVHEPKVADRLVGYYEKVLTDKTSLVYEDSYITSNGARRYSKSRLTPMFGKSGEMTHIVSVVNDITEEKLAKNAREEALNRLEESSAKYRSLFESNGDAVFTLTLNGQINGGNQVAKELVQWPLNELAGADFCFLVEQQERLQSKAIFEEAALGVFKDHRITLVNMEGQKISCLVKFIPIFVHKQVTGYYLMAKNMSELDVMVSKYLESEKNFRVIAENVYDVIILMDGQKKFLYVSPSSIEIFGVPSEMVMMQKPFFNVHPDDLPSLEGQFQEAVQEARPYSMQLRINHDSRGWLWTEMNGTPVYDEREQFSHMVMVVRDISGQKQYEEQLEFYAFHDSLTGLPNRRFFQEYGSNKLKERTHANEKMALAVLDLDDFKQINDEYGHDSGDLLLQVFAERLSALDNNHFKPVRMGGDEFVIFLEEVQTITEAQEAAKQIQVLVDGDWAVEGESVAVNFSLGIAVSNAAEETIFSLLKRADEAMYKAKKAQINGLKILQP